jgi:uncharacterized membrane protein
MRNRTIDDYFDRLEGELSDLPGERRRELIDELKGHVDEALVSMPDASEADVRNLLDQLGDPADIAAEARGGVRDQRDAGRPGPAWTDWAAVVLLPFGGLITFLLASLIGVWLAPLGWVVGVVFLAMSRIWTLRDKLIGALLFPGGELLPVLLAIQPSKTCTSAGTCTGFAFSPWIGIPLALVLIVTPLVVAMYLASKLRSASTR